eukprot:g787.t1
MQRPNIADLSLDGGPTASGGRRGSASGADEMFGDPLGIRSRKSLSGQASGAGGPPQIAGGRVPGSGVVGGPPRSSVALGGTTGTGSAPPASGSNLARMPGTRKSFSNHDAERERQLAKSSATGLGGAAASRNRASTTSSSSYEPVPRGGALSTTAAVAPAGSMRSGTTRDKEVVDLLPNVEEVLENSRGGSAYGAASTQGGNNPTAGASSTGRSYVQAIPPVWSGRSARYKEAEKESLFDWSAVANCCGLGGNRGDYGRDERNPLSMSRTGGGPPREAAAANNKGSPEKTKVELGGGGAPKEPMAGKMNEQKQTNQPPQYSQQQAQLQNPENLLGYWQEEDESDFEEMERKKRVTDEAERRLAERQAAMNKNKKQPGAGLDASSATSAAGAGAANANRPGAGAQEQQQMKSGDASSEQKGAGAQSELETSKEDVLAASMKNKTPFRWPAWSLSKRPGVLEVKVVDESDEEWVAAVPKQRVVDDKGRDAYLLCEYDWQGERYEEDFAPTSVRRTGEERTIAELFADEQKRGTTTRA